MSEPAGQSSPCEGTGAAAGPFLGKGRVYVVFGPPASGKGTQCKRLAEQFGFVHVSTGDVFRDIAGRGTELGLQAKEFVERGCFVPDEMVIGLVRDRLSQPDVQERGCLLDGFPRTASQAEALLRLVRIDGLFFLQVPDKTLVSRAADRRIDPETGDIYNLKHVPPPPGVVSRLERRDRDDEHSFRQRIVVFKDQSRRVLPLFSGQVWHIEGTLEPDEVFQGMVRMLEAVAGKAVAPARQDVNACAICFEEPADFLVVPCGHQCGCEECLTAVQQHSGRCPICRASVQGIQRVFRCGYGDKEPAASAGGLLARAALPSGPADLEERLDGQAPTPECEGEWSEDEEPDAGAGSEGVSMAVAPCTEVPAEGGVVQVMVSVQVPEAAARAPADICCVVDVSGSMGTAATYETDDGEKKSDGLSVLDIVKHAAKTVVKCLQEGDRLALVAFNDRAHAAMGLTEMTADGQSSALEALEGLRPSGQTNIWGGLLCAMEVLRPGCGAGRQQAILLLTDGQPNICPPRGHIAELRDYRDSHPGFSFQLNTFGFGYSLDSELLLDLATEGQGTYAFIPDAVIVGTVFVNSVANVLSTLAQSSTLNLIPRGGAELAGPVLGGFQEFDESWGRAVGLGPLQSGQSRDLVVPLRLPAATMEPYLEVVLSYPKASGTSGRACAEAVKREPSPDALLALCRADAVSTGHLAIAKALKGKGKEAGEDMKGLCTRNSASTVGLTETDGRLTGLQGDVSGRMSKALQGKDRFNRWGKHYLRALVRSHQLQVCTNFMDPGLQSYGGAMFRALREKGDSIFLSLPPPRPSLQHACATVTKAAPAPNMNTYYAGAGGGCFAPSSTVLRVATCLGDERETPVRLEAVRRGDLLRVADGGVARVRCVARVAREGRKGLVVLPGGLRVTPRHPVRVGGAWRRPMDLPGAEAAPNLEGCVWNLVLDRCHVLLVDGVECATWGHGLQGEVIGHPFFGTQQVVESLESLEGWDEGVVLVQGSWRRASGEIVGLRDSDSDGMTAKFVDFSCIAADRRVCGLMGA